MWRLEGRQSTQTTIDVPSTGTYEVGRSLLSDGFLHVSRVQCVVSAEAGALLVRAAGTNPCKWRRGGGAWMSLAKPHECRLADGDLIALDMKRRDGTVFVVRCSEPAEPPSLEAMESPPHEPVATEPLPQQPVATDHPPPQPVATDPPPQQPVATEPLPLPSACEPAPPAAMELPPPPPAVAEHPPKRRLRPPGGCGCAGHPHCCALCCGICYIVRGGPDSDEEDEEEEEEVVPPPKRFAAQVSAAVNGAASTGSAAGGSADGSGAASIDPPHPIVTAMSAAAVLPTAEELEELRSSRDKNGYGWNNRRQEEAHKLAVALAEDFDEAKDSRHHGYVAMEKVDGIRAIWTPNRPNGPCFLTKNGHEIEALPALAAQLPTDMRLDGEIWAGRGNFDFVNRAMQTKSNKPVDEWWKGLTYVVFDAPDVRKGFAERLEVAAARLAGAVAAGVNVVVLNAVPCDTKAVRLDLLAIVVEAGGEGLMLRRAASPWQAGSKGRDMLKIKPRLDCEAVVLRPSLTKAGSVHCRSLNQQDIPRQIEFDLTWNRKDFSETHRLPPPGTVITYSYQKGLSDGHPRFPTFMRSHGPLEGSPWEGL